MAVSTRRDFLATNAHVLNGVALTGVALRPRSLQASLTSVPHRALKKAAHTYLPEPLTTHDMQGLATAAIDAARASGARYADVRVAERHGLKVGQRVAFLAPDVDLRVMFTYGVRVLVDDQWAFAHGTMPDVSTIAAAARKAVATARGYNAAHVRREYMQRDDFVSAPPAVGTWISPIQIDPFTVPLEEQVALLWACRTAAERPLGGAFSEWSCFQWTRETRVFASTDNALVTQTTYQSTPKLQVWSNRGLGSVLLDVPQVRAAVGGYETALVPNLQEHVQAHAEEAVRLARLLPRSMEVGRYPVVVDGLTFGKLLSATLGQALELDRALGDEGDISGDSVFSPPATVLGQPFFSPLLTVAAGRTFPALQAVRWDDEGVEPQTYPIVTHGQIVDYYTSRQTAAALNSWYQQCGQPMQSHGCAVAPTAADPVMVRTPHLTALANTSVATVDDLCRGIQHGLLVRNATGISVDQQFNSGQLHTALILEIERGAVVRRIRHTGLEFTTRALWKSLSSIGDVSTVQTGESECYKGQPWTAWTQSTTAPAGLFSEVNLVVTGR